jgi:short subunit dehydrogenase-like uncharacterized protein
MAPRIVLFGATGFTGQLLAERLVAQGERPVLAGRDTDRLKRLAERLGADLETVKADVLRQNSVFALVDEGDVLVSTVGPFVKHGEPAVRAAIAAPATYLDSTGEPAFIRRVFEEFDGPARNHGPALMPAMGYDFVPGALAGALAVEAAGDAAVRVDVGYYSLGSGAPSAGTKESLVGATLDPGFALRDGRIVTERGAARIRAFGVKGRERPAISIGSAEHFTLPAAYPQLREVNAYLGWFGPLSRAVQAGSLAGSLVQRLPGARTLLQYTGERLAALTPAADPADARDSLSWIVGAAFDAAGEQLAEVHVRGADAYDFTAGFLAWAARRAAHQGVEVSGAHGPLTAFGLEALEAGCAAAGIERVPTPAAA